MRRPGSPVASRRSAKRWAVPTAIALVLVIAVATLVTWSITSTTDVAEAEQLVLQPIDDPGPDPFTRSVATADPTKLAAFAARMREAAAGSTRQTGGRDEALYGGLGTHPVCDREALRQELLAEPQRATAWAQVQGIQTADIGPFVEGLTPVVLARDAAVTNHSFSNGRARPFQSVLQAGTTVFVDAYGVPRVQCSCGNPLLPPRANTADLEVVGQPWEGFDRTVVRHIQPATSPNQSMQLVDIDSGQALTVPVGDGNRGFGTYLIVDDSGLSAMDEQGVKKQILPGSIAIAEDDGRGGVLFTYEPSYSSGPPDQRERSIHWLPAGAREPQILLDATDPGLTFYLHGTTESSSHTYVLFSQVRVTGPYDEDVTGELAVLDLDSRETKVLASFSGYEGGLYDFSVADNRFMYTDGGEGCGALAVRDDEWNLVTPDWVRPIDDCTFSTSCSELAGFGCVDATALMNDDTMLVLTSTESTRNTSERLSELLVVDMDDGTVQRRFPIDRPWEGGASMAVDGNVVVISDHRASPANRNLAFRVDLESGVIEEMGVPGVVRPLRAPLRLPMLLDDAPEGSVEPITESWLRSAQLPAGICRNWADPPSLTLSDGSIPGIPELEGYIRIAPQGWTTDMGPLLSIGDLDGDEVADGAVAVECNGGGNTSLYSVVVYLAASPSAPVVVPFDTVAPGDGIWPPAVEELTITNGRLNLRWSVWLKDDSHGGPSRTVTAAVRVGPGVAVIEDHEVVDS